MTYIEEVRRTLQGELSDHGVMDDTLIDLYVLLVMTSGTQTSLKDVHDAWSIWRSRTVPDHRSIIPFEELSGEVQEMDRPYMEAIVRTAAHLAA